MTAAISNKHKIGSHASNNDNKHAYASQLNSFPHLRAILALYDSSFQLIMQAIIIIKHAYVGQLNSFTHLRALLVLPNRGKTVRLR